MLYPPVRKKGPNDAVQDERLARSLSLPATPLSRDSSLSATSPSRRLLSPGDSQPSLPLPGLSASASSKSRRILPIRRVPRDRAGSRRCGCALRRRCWWRRSRGSATVPGRIGCCCPPGQIGCCCSPWTDRLPPRSSQGMEPEQQGDNMAGNGGAGQVHWSNAMSTFVLKFLADLVASGTKTSTGFKQVHLNSCARALYENMGVQRTGTQIGNHLRKWKRIYAKVEKLKNMSAALWDEQNCVIRLDPEHYNSHIQVHREDANYLNTPIEHYNEMATIFGNSLATGAFAKGSNDPLGTEVNLTDNDPKITSSEPSEAFDAACGTHSFNNGAESSGTKPPPSKKQRLSTEDDLIVMLNKSLGELSTSIKKLAEPDLAVPEGLYEELKSIPGFDEAHLEHYYAYLCDNPPLARAFYALPRLSSKMIWVARYIKNHMSELI